MNKLKYICLILIGFLIGYITGYIVLPNRKTSVVVPTTIIKDSLVRDSIYIVNESIIKEIRYIEKEYDEKVSTIMSSSDSALLRICTEYINHYNNQRTIKDNESDIRGASEIN